MSWYNLEDTRGDDPANWDCCDEHERVFWKGDSCPDCDAENEEANRIASEWDAKVAADEEAASRQIEAEENERTEREDSYDISY